MDLFGSPKNTSTPPLRKVILTIGEYGLVSMQSAGGSAAAASSQPSQTFVAFCYPVWIPQPVTIDRLFWKQGTSNAGNNDMGIYNGDLVRLVSTGTVAESATFSTAQITTVPQTIMPAGLNYFALSMDDISGSVFAQTLTGMSLALGFRTMALGGVITLPNILVFDATSTYPNVIVMGAIPVGM